MIYKLLVPIAAIALSACSSIDCGIDNTVSCSYSFQNSNGKDSTLAIPLTVATTKLTAAGNDTVLINSQSKTATFSLPMGYLSETDTLKFTTTETIVINDSTSLSILTTDTVKVTKTNQPVFESVDCTPRYHHTIQKVEYTKNFIDSIIINNDRVTNDASTKNIIIRLRNNH